MAGYIDPFSKLDFTKLKFIKLSRHRRTGMSRKKMVEFARHHRRASPSCCTAQDHMSGAARQRCTLVPQLEVCGSADLSRWVRWLRGT
jgi:hypothetical protein